MGSIAYRPEIDGLRAVAILAVLAFQMDPACMRGADGIFSYRETSSHRVVPVASIATISASIQ